MIDLENFVDKINSFIFYLDDIEGNRFFRQIQKENVSQIIQDDEKQKAFIALQFLIIPFLSTKEICYLIKNNLNIGLRLDDVDLAERITKKLISLDIIDRDNCKKAIKEAVMNNQEKITTEIFIENMKKIQFAGDWVKDYLSNAGGEADNALEEVRYFYKPYFLRFSDDEKNILKRLFKLYKFLNTSSMTPLGFEDDILLKTEDGKIITTNKGQVVILVDYNKQTKSKEAINLQNNVNNQTMGEKTDISINNFTQNKQQNNASLENMAVQEEKERENKIDELAAMAGRFPVGSLERKAIEEELKKYK